MFETDTALLLGDGKHSLPTWKKIIICCLLIICFVSLYVTLANQKKFLIQYADGSKTTEAITFIPRNDWEPRRPKMIIPTTTGPASYIVISHTNTTTCSDPVECSKILLFIRNNHIFNQKYKDIGYNFLIRSDGGIYIGRGWDFQPDDYHNYKNNSLSVALIGNFNIQLPTDSQLENLRNLIQYGVEHGKIDKNYTLLGHKQFRITDSPGKFLYGIIKKWDHWSSID